MTRKDYNSLREDISTQRKVDERLDFLNEILYDYGQFQDSTLKEFRDYLWKRHLELEERITNTLGIV